MAVSNTTLRSWRNPPALLRSMAFWAWNAALSPARLRRQIGAMHRAGMGGFFMHSRYGLKTPYLSEEWFACVAACVDEARRRGMKACLYDEDRWPSGSAGGQVTREHPEYRARFLEAVPAALAGPPVHRVAILAVRFDGHGGLLSWREVDRVDAGTEAGEQLWVLDAGTVAGSARFNDGAPLDTLNAAAVAEFVRSTYDRYAARCGAEFGRVVPAVFTDEPHYFRPAQVPVRQARRVPWSAALPEEFQRRRGYDLRPHLPELLFDRTDACFSTLRHDFFRTLADVFTESYSAQIGGWCRSHGIAFTGHYLGEQSLAHQTERCGAAMPHYEHQDWPGIDILTDSAAELNTAKQCSSVAAQLGKAHVLSELYGVTGWDWPLEGHKYIGDWQYAAGVNLRCPHLSWYSAAGGAKRDYPASISEHSPWWKYYRIVEDYFGRLGAWLTRGRPVRDVLLIHPIESAWGAFRASASQGTVIDSPLQAPLDRITATLTGEHIDWDFGDESLLARYGKATAAGFRVGRMVYPLVVVPPCFTLRASTVALLRGYLAAGGEVLFVGRRPSRIDGRKDVRLDELMDAASVCGDEVEQFLPAVRARVPMRLSIAENGREQSCLWALLRRVRGGQVLFVQSHDRRAGHRVRVDVRASGPAVRWDALTGGLAQVPFKDDGDTVRFELDIPPTGSALVSLGLDAPGATAPPPPRVLASDSLAGPYTVTLTEPNTLPLDFCRYQIGDGECSGPVPTLTAEAAIRKTLGLPPRSNSGAQPWYLAAAGKMDGMSRAACRLIYDFHVTDMPSECRLALERPGDYTVTVNGRAAGLCSGWWFDEDIRTVEITPLLQAGRNEVALDLAYRADMDLEDLYLVGAFGVRPLRDGALAPGTATLVKRPEALRIGSWVGQGLPFYGGAVEYRLRVQHPGPGRGLRIRLPGIACSAAAVHAGGQTFVLPWAPFEADITPALKEGDNEVVVEVIGGRKNILGPLHVPWEAWTGPNHFSANHPNWRRDYILNDHGLTAPVVLETVKGL